jgi:hypothetical protein
MDLFRFFDQKVYDAMLAFHKRECELVERLKKTLIDKVIRSENPAETLTIALAHFLSVAIVYKTKMLTAKAVQRQIMSDSERAQLMRMSVDESFRQIFITCHCDILSSVYGAHTQ